MATKTGKEESEEQRLLRELAWEYFCRLRDRYGDDAALGRDSGIGATHVDQVIKKSVDSQGRRRHVGIHHLLAWARKNKKTAPTLLSELATLQYELEGGHVTPGRRVERGSTEAAEGETAPLGDAGPLKTTRHKAAQVETSTRVPRRGKSDRAEKKK